MRLSILHYEIVIIYYELAKRELSDLSDYRRLQINLGFQQAKRINISTTRIENFLILFLDLRWTIGIRTKPVQIKFCYMYGSIVFSHISDNWHSYRSKIRRPIRGTSGKPPIAFIYFFFSFSVFFLLNAVSVLFIKSRNISGTVIFFLMVVSPLKKSLYRKCCNR